MRWFFTTSLLTGCATLNGARPLPPGQHEAGVVVGGPGIDFGGPLPLPNLVVGARSGIGHIAGRPLDLGYGINATGLPFGIVAPYGDLGWLAVDQHGAWPALAVRNKLFVSNNFLAKRDQAPEAMAADEITLLASWTASNSIVHASLAQVFDLSQPELLLVPGVGATINPGGPHGLTLAAEVRWYGVNRAPHQRNIPWITGNPGALGLHVGTTYRFGKQP